MSQNSVDVPSTATLADDPEARLEFLLETGVLEMNEDEEITTTVGFEDTRSIYLDTYTDVSQGQLVETVADLFDVSADAARERIEAEEVTPSEVATYLSLQSFLDADLSQESLALLVELVDPVGVGSPVPETMAELTDETYRAFIDDAGDAVVFVWKYPCDPCRRMKGEILPFLEALPADLAIAGVDGESVVDFRREFDVDAAPEVLLFADGELVSSHRGYTSPAVLADSFADVYDGVDVEFVEEA